MSKAISVSAGMIFTIFSLNVRYLLEFSRSGPVFFRFLKGRCHGNQFCGKITYPPPALITLSFRNEMGCRYFVNSANYASISCENFVKFGPVTPELTELICERQVRHGQKTGAFSRICSDILDLFSQSFHHMKASYVQMMDLYIIFQFVEGRCHGNQIILRKCYQRRLIPLAFVALVLEN